MTLFGFPDFKIELDVAEAGALGDISAYVTDFGGFSLEALVEEITAAGDDTDRWAALGFTQKSAITLGGPYDSTAAKLVAICSANLGKTLTLQMTFDGATAADVQAVETIVNKVERNPSKGKFTAFAVTLQPTGAIS